MDSGHKSNFSQTCSLLSQYLKENGSFGDLRLGLSSNLQPHAAATTKNLLPMIEKSGQNNVGAPTLDLNKSVNMYQQQGKKSVEPERAQMTIFYAGQVIVFNDFPADKAGEIMAMASKTGPQNHTHTPTTITQKPPESAAGFAASNMVPSFGNSLLPSQNNLVNGDMPIMRNASLARFFAKRKDRIKAKAPYPMNNDEASSSRPIASKTWLGLATQSQLQIERQA